MTYDEQLARCDHVPFMHCVLSNRFECLCGKTSIPVTDTCPSIACLCGRPKAIPTTHERNRGNGPSGK
jgi:hypothetical protein